MSTKLMIHLHNIDVKTIYQQSGIFIGTNEAIGWYCATKMNNGFGNVSDSLIVGCRTVVVDDDFIDTHSKNVHPMVSEKDKMKFEPMHTNVFLQKIDVNALMDTSAISVGLNHQNHWTSQFKQNMGNGTMAGKTIMTKNFNAVHDKDIFDMANYDTKV